MQEKEALDITQRASMRAAALIHGQMKRGLASLATIASTAPWLGIFATLFGIINSFPGFFGQRETIIAVEFGLRSQALVPTAFGLLVALVALWCYKYLLSDLEALDSEMERASLELVNHLGR